MAVTAPPQNPDALLPRELGTVQLSAGIFNYTVGSGIFALPAVAVAALGTAAPLAYVACAVVMALVVLCFAEAGSRVAATGGPYAYVDAALGPLVGYVAGALLFLTGLAGAAAVSTLFAASLARLLGIASAPFDKAVIVAVFVVLATINVRGVRTGARLVQIATVAKLVPLLAFVAIGAFFVDPALLEWTTAPSASAVLQTSGILIFAFCGIESALVPSGEVRAPARTVPRAVFIALGAATLLYIAIHCVAQGILGTTLADDKVTPLATAAQSFAGPAGRTVLIVGATLSMFGYLTFAALAGPRSLFAFARDGLLPRGLAAVHPAFRTPYVAIVVYCTAAILLAMTGTFERLAVLANLSAILLYVLCAISAWLLRRRDVQLEQPPFVTPGGPTVHILTCAALAWLFYETVTRSDLVKGGIALAVLLALYAARVAFAGRRRRAA
jgi:basic amino acid/polyamine antiporter, APA family